MPPRRNPALEPTVMDIICQFNKLKPPKFHGGAEPLKYEESKWKLEISLKLWTVLINIR